MKSQGLLRSDLETLSKQIQIFPGKEFWVLILLLNGFPVYGYVAICTVDNEQIILEETGVVGADLRANFRKSEHELMKDEDWIFHNLKKLGD